MKSWQAHLPHGAAALVFMPDGSQICALPEGKPDSNIAEGSPVHCVTLIATLFDERNRDLLEQLSSRLDIEVLLIRTVESVYGPRGD